MCIRDRFIDGKWQQSSDKATYEVINPATEEVLGQASKATPEDGDSALKFELFFSMNRSFEANFVKSDLRYKIFEKLKELDIEIPFPQRVVTHKNNPSKIQK